ncbi:MAG: ATP-binding protein [Spirochaetaceae bacterium]|nr:ATP-binding protein [Spirochaetaceae bacterium]
MFRSALNDLISWKHSTVRKPLIIRGARQVGKTWLMKEFGKTQYTKYAYINFENNERMEQLFNGSFEIPGIIAALQIETEITIEHHNTLLIFDEVQEVPRALTSLKYFYEEAPEYHIVAAGSLLGVALHPGTSFPVGKVSFLDLHPLDFTEFMLAMQHEDLNKLLEQQNIDLISTFKMKYVQALKQYYFVGGMPEAVAAFSTRSDYSEVRSIHNNILMAYEQDFSRHAPSRVVPRIRLLWNSIPAQLAREQKKFIYGLIKSGARAREYELALAWLIDCGLIHKVEHISKPSVPLAAYASPGSFKLFLLDIGLLSTLSRLDIKSILNGNTIFQEFKGALTEQFVLQQFRSNNKISPYYWTAAKGAAEVDFVFQLGGKVVPVEVKAAENLQSKSLKSYVNKYRPKYAVRSSMSDYRKEDWLINIPLYAINHILALLENNQR